MLCLPLKASALGVFFVAAVMTIPVVADEAKPSPERVDFVRDVEPIFAAKCYSCHGPDEQEGQLRLDARAIVLKGGVSGSLFEKGKGKDSLLYKSVAGVGDVERMPLEGEPLSDEQIATIVRWVDEGAVWPDGVGVEIATDTHWAYVPPIASPLPTVNKPDWIRTPVDAFILRQLDAKKLVPSPRADDARLLRRVYLDLIGLPPSVEEVDAFVADHRPDKYERVVDSLLASPQYGAKWARLWLDAARYADSNGYQADQYREVWPYRDWVINAMNADMPFDQFTLEQLAGDLLPEATIDQKIATGFSRLTTCNVEAGVDPEENRVNQIIDRVNTTGTVWLGSSIECAQCHNHKYDPFTQRDYYQLFAYFNNTPLEVEGNGVTYEFVGPKMDLPLTDEQKQERAKLIADKGELTEQLEPLVTQRLQGLADWEQQVAASPDNAAKTNEAAAADASQPAALPAPIAAIVARPADKRNAKQKQQLEDYYLDLDPPIKKLREQIAGVEKKIAAVQPVTTLVMIEEEKPRETTVFKRGNFLDQGEPVSMSTPEALPELLSDLGSPDRRELAKWLTSRENPLTARVAVNRWWAEMFGRGIVATLEDFGTQGERPTHPELLDWLAIELMDSGWSMKHVHRQIVLSATYQQSSRVTPNLLKRDPYNKLYARAPRFRLPAETVRDNALAIAGLLSHKMAGPPIFPPQPPNIWRHVGRNEPKYNTSEGNDRYRRGIYVIWRRSAPYPSFINFDAPDRASCVVDRPRTNTPLQALTLLNDPAYVEMAIALAERIATAEESMSVEDRVAFAVKLCVARSATEDEVQHLAAVYQEQREQFESSPAVAKSLVGKPSNSTADTKDVAAWFYIANILLNLDETITKS